VLGNLIGTDATGKAKLANATYGVFISGAGGTVVGGATAGARNVISGNGSAGVFLNSTTTGTQLLGDYIGVDISGAAALGNGLYGVYLVGAPRNTIGGTAAGDGNVISANGHSGVYFSGGTGNQVLGNLIGTNAAGNAKLGNTYHGVYFSAVSGGSIGGTAAGAGNVISGNGLSGIYLTGGSKGNLVYGNAIGTDAAGMLNLGNTKFGVLIDQNSSNNAIGTSGAGSNKIAFNGIGVNVVSGTGNAILYNSIWNNSGAGITLGSGANHNQSAPNLTSAVVTAGTTLVQGTLTSLPSTTFTLQLFVNSTLDPAGMGEGQSYHGTYTVMTDSSGHATISIKAAGITAGQYLTMTATDPNGNTSVFSLAVKVVNG
jgi:hypothetical protein